METINMPVAVQESTLARVQELETNVLAQASTIEARDREIEGLRQEADALRRSRDEALNTNRMTHEAFEHDINVIGYRLIQESNDRGWCEQFDAIIEEVNNQLCGQYPLPIREQEFELLVRVRATCYTSKVVTVRASTLDQAVDMVKDDPCEYLEASEMIEDGFDVEDWEIDNVDSY